MICQRCGAEIDTRYTFPDGSVQCPGCGLMYRPTYAPQQPQRQAPQQAPQMQQFQQPEQPASPRRRRSAQYADNPPEPPRNNPPPVYPNRNDDEPPKKKSSKKWLIIVAAVLCVLVLAFVGIRIFGGSKKSSGKQIASADMSGVKIEQISASDIAVDEETKVKYVKGELVFVAKDGVTFEQVDDYFRDGGFYENGTELVSYDTTLGIYIVKHSYGASYFELGNEAEITLNYTDLFEDIFPNYVVDIAENSVNDKEWQPWDSKKEQHWGWDAIYMNEAQARLDGMQLTDVDVGVIDNQFYGHDDIGVWSTSYGVDYNSSIKSPEHGTHVSGIIGAANNNGVGIAGVTDRIRLHCFSTYGFSVSGEAEGGSMAITTWLTAIGQLVERNNCKVINISQGFAWKDRKDIKNDDGSQPSQEEYEQIQRQGMDEYLPHVEKILRKILKKHDFLLVVSAGNSNNDDQQSGKAELNSIFNYIKAEDITPHIVVVGSASKTKGGSIYISDYSSYGDRVNVTAPGDNIYSTVPKKDGFMSFLTGSDIYNSGYEYMSGTSMSAPYITGIAALVWNINPNFTSAQVRQFIERGCEATYGYREGQWFSRNETHLFVDAEHVVSNALLEMSISANPPTEPSTPETPADNPAKLSGGIIMMRYEFGEPLSDKSDSGYATKIDLDILNPETGDSQHYRTFSTMETRSASVQYFSTDYVLNDGIFNDDYSLLAALRQTENDSIHVGWIDQSGQFTDVSALVTTEEGKIAHYSLQFYQDYVYFVDATKDISDTQVKRVPINSINPQNVEIVIDHYPYLAYSPVYDGKFLYSDASQRFGVSLDEIARIKWINQSECLVIHPGSGEIYQYKINENKDNWLSDKKLLCSLDVSGVGYAAFSPDCQHLVYTISDDYTETANTELRILSFNDGQTRKVSTDYRFSTPFQSFKPGVVFTIIHGWTTSMPELAAKDTDYYTTLQQESDAASKKIDVVKTKDIKPHSEIFTWTDSRGYTLEAEISLTPWMLQSDKESIEAYQQRWNLSFEGRIPTIENWQLKHSSDLGYYHPWQQDGGRFIVKELSDLYYSWGYIRIKNTTDGWHFTQDNKATPDIQIQFVANNTGEKNGIYKGHTISDSSAIMTRVYYDNEAKNIDGFVHIQPSMTSDTWGWCNFLVAHAESFTPNNPDGVFHEYVKDMTVNIYVDYQLVGSFNLQSE